MKKQKHVWTPKTWQTDPGMIETAKVQYWKGSSMMTAMMTNETAKQLVASHRAFVITSQAIGELDENGQPT